MGRTMSQRWKRAGAVAMVLAATFAAGMVTGHRSGLNEGLERQRERDAAEQRILSWVVNANPDARIKDFDGVAATLMDEAARYGIDYRLVMAMIGKESRWHPEVVGSSGEIGLMQILPSTGVLIAKRLNDRSWRPPTKGRRGAYESLGTLGDSKENVRYGVQYLAWQVDVFGMGATALRAYNRNPARATEHRSWDRYAEDVALRYVALTHVIRR